MWEATNLPKGGSREQFPKRTRKAPEEQRNPWYKDAREKACFAGDPSPRGVMLLDIVMCVIFYLRLGDLAGKLG